MPFAIAVDALNLAADRRGMGRYARGVLGRWHEDPSLDVTLLVRDAAGAAALASEPAARVRTLREARRIPFDAVWYPWNGMRFRLNARSLVTIHDAFAFTHAHRDLVARWREQAPIRRAVRRVDVLTTVSHWSASELARTFRIAPESFAVIAPPVDNTFWQRIDIPPAPRPYVLFVVGPDERKNAALLFDAFERAFPHGNVALTIAGTLRPSDAARLSRAGFAHERVQADDAQLRALYSNALAVAIPSYAEGYGLMSVEAMACGAPVLAADAAALPESCGGAALMLPAHDVSAWSHALRRVAEDAALRDDLRARSLARAARIEPRAPARLILELLRRSL